LGFDIFFQPCRFSGRPVVKNNPFTGEVMSILPEEPLSDAEVKAVRQVLKQVEALGPDEYGCYVVELKDGGGAEVFADDLKTGCMVTLRGITPILIHFLFDLLKAGNWVMLPAMEDTVAITTSPGSMRGVPADFPRIVPCNAADEVGVLLRDGVQAWQEYRDRVVGGG
jgi:hypothetical protein